jgi:hypothetical protein
MCKLRAPRCELARLDVHHFLTAAGLIALVGFAFGENAARAIAQIAVITGTLLFAGLVVAVVFGYFE